MRGGARVGPWDCGWMPEARLVKRACVLAGPETELFVRAEMIALSFNPFAPTDWWASRRLVRTRTAAVGDSVSVEQKCY